MKKMIRKVGKFFENMDSRFIPTGMFPIIK